MDLHKHSFNELTRNNLEKTFLKCIPWKITPTGCFFKSEFHSLKSLMLYIFSPLEESQQT